MAKEKSYSTQKPITVPFQTRLFIGVNVHCFAFFSRFFHFSLFYGSGFYANRKNWFDLIFFGYVFISGSLSTFLPLSFSLFLSFMSIATHLRYVRIEEYSAYSIYIH